MTSRVRPLLLLFAATLLPGPARAQERADSGRWELSDPRGGFCIWYLADPALVGKLTSEGAGLVTAGRREGLPTAVTRIVQDEPRFAEWIPATLCIGFYGSVSVGGEVVARASAERSVMLATSAFAAASPEGAAADWYLADLFATDGGVRRAAEDAGFSADGFDYRLRPTDSPEDQLLEFRISGVTISWVGHAYGEKSVGTTHSMSFGYAGRRDTRWKLVVSTQPESLQPVIGGLRVEGKGRLAKALQSSPIRIVTPRSYGGTASFTFQKVTK